jgi:hypothetical protein
MAEIKWRGFFSYKSEHQDIVSVLKGNSLPVAAFSVKGGRSRVIDLASPNDIDLAGEFLQARNFKNVTVFLSPTKGFEWLDLTEISIHRLPVLSVFFAQGKIGETVTHEFTLGSVKSRITEPPGKATVPEKGLTLMRVSISLPDPKLTHGSPQGSEFVQEEW